MKQIFTEHALHLGPGMCPWDAEKLERCHEGWDGGNEDEEDEDEAAEGGRDRAAEPLGMLGAGRMSRVQQLWGL